MAIYKRVETKRMVLGAVMTSLVIILQLLATFTKFFGPFSTAIALIPIAVGAVMCGPMIGAWLGFVFGVVVLASGGAALFWAFDIPGTLITVLAKGTACGLCAGLVYKLIMKFNDTVAAIVASVLCPVVNTGIFLVGSAVFFLDDANKIAQLLKESDMAFILDNADKIAQLLGMKESVMALFLALALANFAFEVVMNVLLSPVIIRLMKIVKKD